MTRSSKPRVITRSDPTKITIEWEDGHETALSTAQLRSICPCAACVDELSGVRRHDPSSVAADLEHKNVALVGNYALTIRFADGHDTGIYPFTFLRDQDPSAPPHG